MAVPPKTPRAPSAPPRPVAIDIDHDHAPDADVFLTPRVVDETAFDRFAGDLRRLIQDAASAGRALVRTGSETDRHLSAMRDAAKELRTQVETGARLIPTIDQRIERIDDAVTKAEAIATNRADLEARVAEQVDAIVAERLEAATARAAGVAQRMGDAIAKASELTNAIAKRLDAATDAATEAAVRTEKLAATLTEHADRAESLIAHLTESTTHAEGRINEGEQRIGDALTEAEVASQALTGTIAEVTADITPHVEAARALVADAQKLAADPMLNDAVKTGESSKRTLLRAIREAKSIIEQTDLARRQLADDLEQAAERIDAVEQTGAVGPTPTAQDSDGKTIRFRRTDDA